MLLLSCVFLVALVTLFLLVCSVFFAGGEPHRSKPLGNCVLFICDLLIIKLTHHIAPANILTLIVCREKLIITISNISPFILQNKQKYTTLCHNCTSVNPNLTDYNICLRQAYHPHCIRHDICETRSFRELQNGLRRNRDHVKE